MRSKLPVNSLNPPSRLPVTLEPMNPIVESLEKMVKADNHLFHIKAFDLVPQAKKLVISTEGIVQLGEILGDFYLNNTQ